MRQAVELTAGERIAPYLALGALALLAYFPALRGGLVWGDAEHITRPELRSLAGLQRIWFEPGATPGYAPVLHTFYWLEHRLWNGATLGYHLASVLLHAWAAGLLFALVRRLEVPGAFLAAVVFVLHPAAVESVAWISRQGNPLSAVFYLGAALLYVSYDRERIMWQYDVALALFVLALLTAAGTATLPIVLLLLFWAERGVLEWRRDVVPLLPWLALGAGALGLASWFQLRLGATPELAPSVLDRVLSAARAVWFYLRALAWPRDLNFMYPGWTFGGATRWGYAALVALLGLVAALLGLARRHRAPLAGFLAVAVTLLPALGILNAEWLEVSFVADRFLYLASLGLIVPAALAIGTQAARADAKTRRSFMAVGVLVTAVLGGITWRLSARFRNGETLYRHTLAHHPDAWLAHHELGVILAGEPGRLASALEHFGRAIELKPDYAPAYHNLGRALARVPGALPKALAAYENAIRLRPDQPAVHIDYGDALAEFPERWAEAIEEYQRALHLDPESGHAHYRLGRALARIPGRAAEAISAYEKAVQLDPAHVDAYRHLGDALAPDPARAPDAIAAYQGALHVQPLDVELRRKLAAVLAVTPGRRSEAIDEYQKLLHLAPADTAAHAALKELRAVARDDAPPRSTLKN